MPEIRKYKDASPRWFKNAANVSTRRWGMATSRWRDDPDFVIVGTKRGGTTSLWNNLLRHPQVIGMYPQSRGRKSSDYFFSSGRQSDRWFASHFPSSWHRAARIRRAGNAATGEASPYYMYGPHAPRMISERLPAVRVIALLRDPVERAYSHYQERRQQLVEDLDFEAALAAETARLQPDHERWASDPCYYSPAHDFFSYRDRGIYLPQIKRLQEAFPPDRLLIMRSEDFYTDYQSSFDVVTRFIGLDDWTLTRTEHHNLITRKPMNDATRRELTWFFAPHNEALESHLGRTFDWSKPDSSHEQPLGSG